MLYLCGGSYSLMQTMREVTNVKKGWVIKARHLNSKPDLMYMEDGSFEKSRKLYIET